MASSSYRASGGRTSSPDIGGAVSGCLKIVGYTALGVLAVFAAIVYWLYESVQSLWN